MTMLVKVLAVEEEVPVAVEEEVIQQTHLIQLFITILPSTTKPTMLAQTVEVPQEVEVAPLITMTYNLSSM